MHTADNPQLSESKPGPVIVVTGASRMARCALRRYVSAFSRDELVIVEEHPPALPKLMSFVRRRAKRSGYLGVADAIALRLISDFAARHGADADRSRFQHIASVNSSALCDLATKHRARTIVLNLCSLATTEQLRRLALPVLNVHPGINPRYRGAGNFWAIHENNFDLIGATLHHVDQGIDTGKIIATTRFDPAALGLSMADVDAHAMRCGADLAIAYLKGNALPQSDTDLAALESRFYPYPGLTHWLTARRNYRARQINSRTA